MFVSYSQNSEDLVLWRALRHIENGTYVDVGAADPTEFSVTRAFYDRGWSGFNIEPAPHYVQLLREERPRDVTVEMCAGAQPGTVTLHLVPDTGLSTMVDDHLAVIADQHFDVVDLEVEMRRLDVILVDNGYDGRDIHFLKVDVEGAEEQVLLGIDFTVWRPWVVVVEATEPLSTAPSHVAWEHLLLEAGYEFCLFDGLNRFYVATEHEELRPALSYPAGVFDRPYVSAAGDTDLATVLDGVEAQRAALAGSYEELQGEYAQLLAGHRHLQDEYQRVLDGHRTVQDELDRTLSAYGQLQAAHDVAVAGYASVETRLAEVLESYDRLSKEHDRTIDGLRGIEAELANANDGYRRLHAEYDHVLDVHGQLEVVVAERSAERDAAIAASEVAATAAHDAHMRVVAERDQAVAERDQAVADLAALRGTVSWRLTRPLRAVRRRPPG